MSDNNNTDLKSDKYIVHRTLVSVGLLLTSFMIAWLKGWKESIELCDTPDVNVFAIMFTFWVALATTVGIVVAACIFLFVVEVVFVNVLKLRNGSGKDIEPAAVEQVVYDAVTNISLGFRIVIEWLLNWRLVLIFVIALAFAGAFAQGILLLLYILRADGERSISSLTFRRAVNVIYTFLLVVVVSALLLQVWCSSQKW
jgi:hypothetical protein